MSETNGNGNGHNGHKNGNGKGRKNGSTVIATISTRAQAVQLFLSGKSVPQIAAVLNISERTTYQYLQTSRAQLIAEKKEHFDEQLAVYLDDTFFQISTMGSLLGDRDWLNSVEPERIDSVARTYGILSDKCFVLLAAAGRNKPAGVEQPEVR